MVSINLSEVENKQQIAKIIREKMERNGIKKSEIIIGTHLSKTAINSVLCTGKLANDYRFETLLKVLNYLKIQLFIGRNEEVKTKVLSLF
jgi:predicted XRE-type DNA-binding protein